MSRRGDLPLRYKAAVAAPLPQTSPDQTPGTGRLPTSSATWIPSIEIKPKKTAQIIKTWFTEGVDDPRITVIKVAPSEGYYWDTKHGSAIAGIKMLIGAAIGRTLDDSIEGTLTV